MNNKIHFQRPFFLIILDLEPLQTVQYLVLYIPPTGLMEMYYYLYYYYIKY